MMQISSRIFADHYQFYIYDSEYKHFSDDRLNWITAEREQFGYISTEMAIYVSTVADLNSHRLRVYLGEEPNAEYERVYSRDLAIPSGRVVISAPANEESDDLRLSVEKGNYTVFVCSNSIGKDMLSYDVEYDDDMTDEEYVKHDEFEYYDIFLLKTA